MKIVPELKQKLVEAIAESFEQGRHQECSAYKKALLAVNAPGFDAQSAGDGVSLMVRGNSGEQYYTDWNTCQCAQGVKGRKTQDGEMRYMCWHVALVRAWVNAYVFAETQSGET